MAQLFLAAAVMVLGYDALNALETGAIEPISPASLSVLIANQTGLADGLDVEAVLGAAAGWPGFAASAYGYVVTAPAFLILGVFGLLMALIFRARG